MTSTKPNTNISCAINDHVVYAHIWAILAGGHLESELPVFEDLLLCVEVAARPAYTVLAIIRLSHVIGSRVPASARG